MSEAAQHAAYKAIARAFTAQGATQYPDVAPPLTARPYFVAYWLGGGQQRIRRSKDSAELVFGIIGVADNLGDAMAMAGNINSWFDDKGSQEVTTGALDAGPDWRILTSSCELVIHLVEDKDKPRQIYSEGQQVRFKMEAV